VADKRPAWGFHNDGKPHDGLKGLPIPPPWRRSSAQALPLPLSDPPYDLEAEGPRGVPIVIRDEVVRAINAALLLRRPLLVTGKPGIGKSSIIARVAHELRMGPVLRWPINSRSTVKRGLYEYDAIARLQAQQNQDPNATLGDFLRLGPLGTALYPTTWPRALLIDEIDKGDLDLPNDLLNVLEEGQFEIEELVRVKQPSALVRVHDADRAVEIRDGRVQALQFPFIVMTSNGEREFPAPLLRRCVRVTIPQPASDELSKIVSEHLKNLTKPERDKVEVLVRKFVANRAKQDLATDQLLNAVFVVLSNGIDIGTDEYDRITDLLYAGLSTTAPQAAPTPTPTPVT
jgi:MoxR-like ATPase